MKPATLLRLYPRSWRERYGEEFIALMSQTGATPAQVIDVVHAAGVERLRSAIRWTPSHPWRNVRDAARFVAGSFIAGSVIAVIANVVAFEIHARYGALPAFNSTTDAAFPHLIGPPAILQTLAWYSRWQWLILPRMILSGGPVFCLSRWLRVSKFESALWAAVILISATALQLQMFAYVGEPGFPVYSRFEIFSFAWPDCFSNCLFVAMASTGFRDLVIRSRNRPCPVPNVPSNPLGLA